MIGRLERVPLRDVWPMEAADFTPWLKENLDVLNEILDISLTSAESEQAAGALSVDLVAEDQSGNPVTIENQLGRSDHDHLGKLITYLAVFGARAAVWIVADPRPEHVSAVSWLNESSEGSFYLLKAEAVRIGDSAPAPFLTLIVGPSEERHEIVKTKKELAERHLIRQRFWTQLLERARETTNLHANVSPGHENWISTGVGVTGLGLSYVVRMHDCNVELYIDRGNKKENEAIFDRLYESRENVESKFGEPLVWQRLESKRACRIRYDISIGGYRDEDRWDSVQDAMIDAMVRFDRAIRSRVNSIWHPGPWQGPT